MPRLAADWFSAIAQLLPKLHTLRRDDPTGHLVYTGITGHELLRDDLGGSVSEGERYASAISRGVSRAEFHAAIDRLLDQGLIGSVPSDDPRISVRYGKTALSLRG
jgi:hypothetical protein